MAAHLSEVRSELKSSLEKTFGLRMDWNISQKMIPTESPCLDQVTTNQPHERAPVIHIHRRLQLPLEPFIIASSPLYPKTGAVPDTAHVPQITASSWRIIKLYV